MRIMTSNIWGDFFGNEVSVREGQLYNVYKKYSPDIIGMQEATGAWYLGKTFLDLEKDGYLFLGTHFIHPELYHFAPGQPLYEDGVNVPLLVKKDTFKVLDYGWELLRNTPDHSKSITWAVLETKEEHKVFGVCNTHFWWMERNEEDFRLRAENAKQLTDLMKYINEKHNCPVFAMGDLNARIDSEVFQVFDENGVKDLIDEAETASWVSSWHGDPERGEDGRYHGKKTQADKSHSLDHMMGYAGGYRVKEYKVVEDQDALDATDHSPVYVDVEL